MEGRHSRNNGGRAIAMQNKLPHIFIFIALIAISVRMLCFKDHRTATTAKQETVQVVNLEVGKTYHTKAGYYFYTIDKSYFKRMVAWINDDNIYKQDVPNVYPMPSGDALEILEIREDRVTCKLPCCDSILYTTKDVFKEQ